MATMGMESCGYKKGATTSYDEARTEQNKTEQTHTQYPHSTITLLHLPP